MNKLYSDSLEWLTNAEAVSSSPFSYEVLGPRIRFLNWNVSPNHRLCVAEPLSLIAVRSEAVTLRHEKGSPGSLIEALINVVLDRLFQ